MQQLRYTLPKGFRIQTRGVSGEPIEVDLSTGQTLSSEVNRPKIVLPTTRQQVQQEMAEKRAEEAETAAERAVREREIRKQNPALYDEIQAKNYTNKAIEEAQKEDKVAQAAGAAASAIDGGMIAASMMPGIPGYAGKLYWGFKGAKSASEGNYVLGALEASPILGAPIAQGARYVWNSPASEYAKFLYRLRYGTPNMQYTAAAPVYATPSIQSMSYFKPWRDSWTKGTGQGNEATSYFWSHNPSNKFELVKDVEPQNYSVHFKTDRATLPYGEKMGLFAKVADEVPAGSNLSTWGTLTKGGVSGVNRFGNFGFNLSGLRSVQMDGGTGIDIPVWQKPVNGYVTQQVWRSGPAPSNSPYTFFTTDKNYAAQFGTPQSYTLRFRNGMEAAGEFVQKPGSFDMGMDMTHAESQQLASRLGRKEGDVLIGHDLVTSDVKPSNGVEYAVWNPQQIVPTSLKLYERPSKLSNAERLGIPKGDRNNMDHFQIDGLNDFFHWYDNARFRKIPFVDENTGVTTWGKVGEGEPAIRTFARNNISGEGSYSTRFNYSGPNVGQTIALRPNGDASYYVHGKGFQPTQFGPMGDLSAASNSQGIGQIYMTSPYADAINIVAENAEEEALKQSLIQSASHTIPKETVRSFWQAFQKGAKPGSYTANDAGTPPLGYDLISLGKKLHTYEQMPTDNTRTAFNRVWNSWDNIAAKATQPIKYREHGVGYSTDSYLSLLKQGVRPGSRLKVSYSKDGMTKFNDQSFDNRYIQDLLEKANSGEIPKQQFIEEFNKWVAPYKGLSAKLIKTKRGEFIWIPHPFLYALKQGGKICNR